jgi:hypothetical protein
VVGASPDAVEARTIRARAKEVSEVVQGVRDAEGTKYGPIIKPGPVKPGKPIRGRDVAAKFIYEQLLGAGEAKGWKKNLWDT